MMRYVRFYLRLFLLIELFKDSPTKTKTFGIIKRKRKKKGKKSTEEKEKEKEKEKTEGGKSKKDRVYVPKEI